MGKTTDIREAAGSGRGVPVSRGQLRVYLGYAPLVLYLIFKRRDWL